MRDDERIWAVKEFLFDYVEAISAPYPRRAPRWPINLSQKVERIPQYQTRLDRQGSAKLMHDKLRRPLLARSALRLAAARGLRHEPAEFLRLPRVGLHLFLGKIALQPQDLL
jgi:hypothetical protein